MGLSIRCIASGSTLPIVTRVSPIWRSNTHVLKNQINSDRSMNLAQTRTLLKHGTRLSTLSGCMMLTVMPSLKLVFMRLSTNTLSVSSINGQVGLITVVYTFIIMSCAWGWWNGSEHYWKWRSGHVSASALAYARVKVFASAGQALGLTSRRMSWSVSEHGFEMES